MCRIDRLVILVALTAVVPSVVGADELKRSAFFGAKLAPPSADDRAKAKVERGGALIQQVLPDSSAQAAGLHEGDLVTSLAGKPIDGPGSVVAAMASRKSGESIRVEWSRGGEKIEKELTLRERPREKSDAYDVVYGSIDGKSGRLRTIMTRPRVPGKRPALFLVQGIGGYSVDNALGGPMGYAELIDAFTRKGYVTFRVEKPGQGDSEGGPTRDVDFDTELDAYRRGLKALRSLEFVDTSSVLIFGHSMGGVWGPLLGAEGGVKGIAVYGTVTRTWYEYILENVRRQEELAGADPADIDRHVRQEAAIQSLLLADGRSAGEIIARHPDLRERIDEVWQDGRYMVGRSLEFFRQLAAKDVAKAWEQFGGHALAIWGEADYVSSPLDHEMIARLVDRSHPGNGKFLRIPDSDHGFARMPSPAESFVKDHTPGATGEFNPAVINALLEWADEVTRAGSILP